MQVNSAMRYARVVLNSPLIYSKCYNYKIQDVLSVIDQLWAPKGISTYIITQYEHYFTI